jgi:mono/diheme cytochrome c family protein
MTKSPWVPALALAGAAAVVGMATIGRPPARPSREDVSVARVARGKYLVTAIGCGDCHTPKVLGPKGPVEDHSRLLSGHPEGTVLPEAPKPTGPWIGSAAWDLTAWSGPWGVSYTFNLTPDENTGIGSWSEDTFVKAIKTGRHMGVSRPILPPMPWGAFRNLTDEDLGSIYAYLRTIPAIHNRVPDPVEPAEASPASSGAPGRAD